MTTHTQHVPAQPMAPNACYVAREPGPSLSDVGRLPPLKRCSKCNALKPLTAFTRDKKSADGYYSSCKACCNQRVKTYYEKNPEKRKAASRRAHAKRRREALRQFQQWAAQHPFASLARAYVRKAMKVGRLVMPDTCDSCGEAADILHCHHPDYTRPLHVTTLCASCHRALHCKEACNV